MMVRRHYLVTGRVQGVGFRNFVFRQASALGVVGTVRNLRDGRVELVAKADERAMQTLEAALARGPSHAEVKSVETHDLATTPHSALDAARDFTVAADGGDPWPAT